MPSHSRYAETARRIADAAARWCDADFPPRVCVQPRIVDRTRYSLPVVEYALDRLFGAITADAILSTIAGEIDGRAATTPIGRVAVISSRTTIGVALFPAIFAICAGCEVVVKDREDGLIAAFFETLAEELGGPPVYVAREQAGELSTFDCVVAFGGNEALAAIGSQLRPGASFIPYGPKASIGYVGRDALCDIRLARHVAAGAARDLVLYESEGCLSLHALFVERDAPMTPTDFMGLLAGAVERANIEFPIGERDPAAAARVASLRDLALFRGDPFFSDAAARSLIQTGTPDRAPAFAPRVLDVHDVAEPAEMRRYVERHALPVEACAVAGTRPDIERAAAACGAYRVAAFGELQNPPLAYAHGGRPRFAEFVAFVSEGDA